MRHVHRTHVLLLAIVVGSASGVASFASSDVPGAATAVRGVILMWNSYHQNNTPVPGVKVDIYSRQTKEHVATSYTDAYGFYYFDLPPAAYVLVIDDRKQFPIRVHHPASGEQFQDLPPIKI